MFFLGGIQVLKNWEKKNFGLLGHLQKYITDVEEFSVLLPKLL
jgi:hypothetical protein